MATSVAPRFDERLTEVILHNFGQPSLRLHRRCKCGTVTPRCRLTKTTQGDVDDPGIVSAHVVVSQIEACQSTRPKVLDDNICVATQIGDYFARLREVQIDADVTLSGILLDVVKPQIPHDRQTNPADISRWRLYLHYIGTQVPQRLRAMGPGENAGKVDDPQTFQRSWHD